MEKTSKEAVKVLRAIADFLESVPSFDLDYYQPELFTFYSKEKFVVAAKVLGEANKVYGDGEYANFKLVSKKLGTETSPVTLSIARDKVCRKVVKFECEPLFSPEEIDNL